MGKSINALGACIDVREGGFMQHVREPRPIELPARSVYRIEGGKGLQITSVAGSVWLTQSNDPRDIVLGRGRSFILDRNGVAVVYALGGDAAIVIGPAGHIAAADFAAAASGSGGPA
jgi:hypothetical protein